MPSPALVVGIGGTGTLVATYVKKELMETSGGVWPLKEVKVLAYDTDNKPPDLGGQGQIRQAGQTTGAVRLEPGEFCFIGGNVQALMREVANGKHDHLRNWLQAHWYMDTLSDKIFNLNEGAGQFRQFGRLAVFKDVATPSNSTLYGTLNDALVKLKRDNPTATSFQVFVTSSLAGGTGAGMFADVAYLIRKIAEQSNVNLKGKMSIRGYLVLPEAFSRTVDQSWLRSMNARAFAAMRENGRFTVSFDYARGYPMYYQESGNDPIWHNTLKGKLFDLLYYLDGQGERSQLGVADIRNGVAPAIADTISAAIDKESGPVFSSYVANVEAERASRIQRAEISKKTPTLGSVGTYSVVFPIYQIVEGWTHDLGLSLLKNFIQPDDQKVDSRTGVPTSLLSDANQENQGEDGRTAAQKFLKATKPLSYSYRDENGDTKTLQAEPTLLFGELARISEAALRPGKATVQELANRTIGDWNPLFAPHGDDRETQRLLTRIENILKMRLYDSTGKEGQVIASDQSKQKEDPILGFERIIADVRQFKNRHLGDEDSKSGQRSGGVYRETALKPIIEYHSARFNLYLDYFIQATMNGSPNRSSLESKCGKLGYLADFLESLFEMLNRTQDTLKQVQQGRREKGDSRRNAMASAETAKHAMKSLAGKKGLMGGVSSEAFQSQHNYLKAENILIDILQAEATEDAILDTVGRMIDYVNSARESVRAWVQTLGAGSDGLYAQLVRGKKQANSDRAAERDIHCHLVVGDEKYEQTRYEEYVSANEGWMSKLLDSLSWQLKPKMQAGRPKIELSLSVLSPDGSSVNLNSDVANLNLWLNLCRQPFKQARQTESVIGYLMQSSAYGDPGNLADQFYKHSGVSLNMEGGGKPLPANYLRAYFQDAEESGHKNYLRSVIQSLAQRSGQSSTETVTDESGQQRTQDNKFARFVNSEDRFKLTLIFTQELVELQNVTSYKNSRQSYMGDLGQGNKADRRILHIFPAEVNAAEYETRLPELQQNVRLFSDDVALQLEDKSQFRLFMWCYVYGLVKRAGVRDPKTNENRLIWQLVLPPDQEYDELGNPSQPDEIWITKPNEKAFLLDAMMTFNFDGLDVRQSEELIIPIDYDKVSRALKKVREEDALKRINDGTAGERNKDLQTSLSSISDPTQRQIIISELARIDRISEQYSQLTKKKEDKNNLDGGDGVLAALSKVLADASSQKEYDIASLFALMMGDEIKSVRQEIKDRIRALSGRGPMSGSAEAGFS